MRVTLQYVFGTSILSDRIPLPQGPVARQIATKGEETVCTRLIVAAELRYGGAKAESKRLSERFGLVLSDLEVRPLENPDDLHHGAIRPLARHDAPMGPNDLLIAAHTRSISRWSPPRSGNSRVSGICRSKTGDLTDGARSAPRRVYRTRRVGQQSMPAPSTRSSQIWRRGWPPQMPISPDR